MNKAVGVADTTPPNAPTNFAKTGSTGTTIATSWTASTDNVGVTGYNLYRGTTQVATVSTTTYTFTGLACGTSYGLGVEAVDGSGNVSTRTPLTASTDACDTTAPSAPGSLGASPSGTSVALTWTAATDNVGVVRYNVHRGTAAGFTPSAANRIAQPTTTGYTDSGLAAGTYYYKVTAEDAAGNVGPASNEATATITSSDTTPPSAPGTLGASPSGTSVALTWTAATDNVGVVRYNVHRGTAAGFTPSAANRIAQPTTTGYTDSGLAAGTYYYKVTAEDAAGNVGPASNEASATVGSSDTTPPTVSVTAPAAGSTVSGTVSVTASASDNTSVAGVQFKLDGANLGAEDTSAPYSVSWNTTTATNGSHTLTAVARDPSGNQATAASVGVTVSNVAPPATGLVAAWAFDEPSGTSAADATGTGHTGTLNGPVWTTGGKFGGALSFDGVNDWVTVADANDLDLTNGMTLEAWVKPTATGDWRTVVFKEGAAYYTYGLYGNTGTNVPSANAVAGGSDRDARAATAAPVGAWTHLAATYDGTTLRIFVNGVQSGQAAAGGSITTSTGVLRIGGNSVWPEWFAGLIDEVRIYNRALSATEIQADMASSVGTPDTSPPTAPTGLAATGGLGQVSLTWAAATDDTGVSRYNVHRGTSSGFVPGAGNLVGQSTTTSYLDQGLAAGTYYYKVTAQDAAGNVGPASNEATAAATADTTAPTVAITAPTAGATVSNTVAVSANASDNVGVAGVQFKLDGANLGAEDTSAPYAVSWDTTAATNAAHTLTAVARDPSGNQTTSASVSVTVSNTATPPPTGLVAAYGFDEGAGTSAGDAGSNGNNGTLAGPTWTIGRFGTALQFDGVNDWATVPDSASLDITRMTLEAWVYPTTSNSTWRTVVFKEQTGDLVYGMYAQTSSNQPSGHAYVSGSDRVVKGTSPLPVNQWSHLAATYDGSAVRLYVNATLVGTTTISGSISTSTGALRIGGNGVWPEWFTGRLDEIRVYNRALSASEIQSDMSRPAAADALAPTVTATTPASGAIDIPVSATVTATFSEAMDATSLTSASFELKDGSGTAVPATVTYDPITAKATLAPSGALVYGTTYTAVVHGGTSGSRAKDMSGNALAADKTWTFSTEAAPPPILVLGSTANPFSTYTAELLRAEGMNDFAMLDVSLVNPVLLSFYDVVVLGDVTLTPTQVTTLTNWVTGGGNLIALSPDKQLAGLLGLADAGTTLADKYLKVDNAATGGAGITSATMQYHGSADRYTLSGATAVATLYSTASTATTNPAVSIRSVGSSGGQAAAFTFDLARSVAFTRQGNPAWAGQERDGVVPIRPDDLFFGAKSGDVQPDYVDVSKLAIPQADEQQRLLVNLVTTTAADRKPLPRFWYLPRMAEAVVVMTGDDHAVGGTAGRFDQYKSLSPAGCNVANWECIRSTSYVYPNSPLTNAQAQAYQTDGFEVALHPQTGQPCANWTPASLRTDYTTQLNAFKAKYTSAGTPVTSRTHCVAWSDWLTMAIVEGENGVRLDTNYYHYPGSWIGGVPGFMTGAGFPMRFVDTAGASVNVYMAHTFMTDESGQSYPATVNALLDGALGPNGYYGAFTANMHTDNVSSPGSDAIVSSAQARGVPIISAKQFLTWWEAREASTMRSFVWDGSALTLNVAAPAAANGLRMLIPRTAAGKTLAAVTRDGSAVAFTLDTIKGIEYAIVPASTGSYRASYS
ncbi:MAG TPA: LamG-like jellyroll fold domain-containing protein [Gaiellaceae bacterium]|nr:LamG-like jellyroll fold domain-containing protein [Gaiellaceae bacterium]